MKTDFPQDKIQIFLDILEPSLATAMPALLHPSPSLPLLNQMNHLLKSLGTTEIINTYNTIRAALLILADDLSSAHDIVQSIHTPHAAAFHAIIHRREGDFWNSNYWWRRTEGIHWSNLGTQATDLLKANPFDLQSLRTPNWSPAAFTDAVEKHHNSSHLTSILLEIQRLEWRSLLLSTLQQP